jgi:hypothetical protein
MQITINSDQIIKTMRNNAQIILIILTLVFLYVLFYTNYIISYEVPSTSTSIPTSQTPFEPTLNHSQMNNFGQVQKHVRFDDSRNKEIPYENENGRININYNAPQLQNLQRISQCTYPMNSNNQVNKKDCTIDQSCLTRYSPQEWFKKQRQNTSELPGFNGDTMAQFTFDENIANDMMMRNMVYEDDINKLDQARRIEYKSPTDQTHERFDVSEGYNYDQVTEPKIIYQSVPFNNPVEERGAMPFDLCRNCTVGNCNGDVCGSNLTRKNNNYLL